MKKTLCILMHACLILFACSCEKAPTPIRISRLDMAMQAYKDASDSSKRMIADTLSAEINALFKVLGRPYPGKEELEWWASGDEVAIFQPDAEKAFPSLAALEADLGCIYHNAEKEGLPLDSLRFAAIVYGLPMPLVKVDSVMLIALNHYLGSDYPGYSHWDAYKRKVKTQAALPYDLAAAIVSTSHPMAMSVAPTLLCNMLYEGALVEARMRLLPNANLAHALGVTEDELQFMKGHLREMWREMAEKKMIYDTNPLVSDRMLSGAPSSPLLNGKAPARAGRFIGYCIVKAYLKSHSDATLPFLFTPEFYAKSTSLADAGFNPNHPL